LICSTIVNVKIFKGNAPKVEQEIADLLRGVTEVIHVVQSGGGGSHEKLCVTIIWR
jgi:hypothetical protein